MGARRPWSRGSHAKTNATPKSIASFTYPTQFSEFHGIAARGAIDRRRRPAMTSALW
jgi:hypothetical protein